MADNTNIMVQKVLETMRGNIDIALMNVSEGIFDENAFNLCRQNIESKLNLIGDALGKDKSADKDISVNSNDVTKQTVKEFVDESKQHGDISQQPVIIYVDGSYNSKTDSYGCGVFIDYGYGETEFGYHTGKCMEGGRNVEGEVSASLCGIAVVSDYFDAHPDREKTVLLYHDYEGIGAWGDDKWRANKNFTKNYKERVQRARDCGLDITFEHVKGHTGVLGNEIADKLAAKGAGLEVKLTKKLKEEINNVNPDLLTTLELDDGYHEIVTGQKSVKSQRLDIDGNPLKVEKSTRGNENIVDYSSDDKVPYFGE